MDCPFLGADGVCRGLYSGFGCIGEKCQSSRENICEFLVDGCYCRRLRRFGCLGPANCGYLDDHSEFLVGQRDPNPLPV